MKTFKKPFNLTTSRENYVMCDIKSSSYSHMYDSLQKKHTILRAFTFLKCGLPFCAVNIPKNFV